MKRREIVFVHIPKTGGTSIRIALERAASHHRILRDYQGHSIGSSDLAPVQDKEGQVSGFREHFSDASGILLSGHFPASRYWPFFNAESFVTFLRHPVDRVLSSYAAWVKNGRWRGSFEEFIALPTMGKRLSTYLIGADLDAFGFIGFTEEFDASVRILSEFVGTELQVLRKNPGDYTGIGREIVADPVRRRQVAECAAQDIRIYERLRAARAGVFRAPRHGPRVVGKFRGEVSLERDVVAGWLCNAGREFICNVEIWRGSQRIGTVTADQYLATAKEHGYSRSGVCGFRVNLPELARAAKIQRGDALSFKAERSDYELEGSPVRL